MTPTYKHSVYLAENDKGVIELNAEAKPLSSDFEFHDTYGYSTSIDQWNANTIKAEVSDELNYFIINELWYHWDKNRHLSSHFEDYLNQEQGIDILSLMDRIEITQDSCDKCECFGICKSCKWIATLKPVKEKLVVEKGESENTLNGIIASKKTISISTSSTSVKDDYMKLTDAYDVAMEYSVAQFLRISELEKQVELNSEYKKLHHETVLEKNEKDQRIAELEKELKAAKFDYSSECKCSESPGATWCCNHCGKPVTNKNLVKSLK